MRDFVAKAGVSTNKHSFAFQSRLGRDPWLKPYTDLELERFARAGVKKMLVICPAFVSDCLETIEEIGMRGRDSFIQSGGGQNLKGDLPILRSAGNQAIVEQADHIAFPNRHPVDVGGFDRSSKFNCLH